MSHRAHPVPSAVMPIEFDATSSALLLRLGRPGARLTSLASGAGFINQPTGGRSEAEGVAVPAAVLQLARANGYLIASTAGCEVLSSSGREALRALLMTQPAKRGERPGVRDRPGPQRRGDRRAAAGDAPVAKRATERMAVVEQLGSRRDSKGRPLLTEIQVAAALRLARDFSTGQLQPRITARWSAEAVSEKRRRGAPGVGVDLHEAAAAAQARARSALAAAGGDLANIAIDVCCFERGLEAIEAQRHWPPRSARIVLGLALDRLAEHYGMARETSNGVAATRRWNDIDFRPTADRWTKRD